jgi:hypothetical protein
MQIVPGNAFSSTVSGSAPRGGIDRSTAHAHAEAHGRSQAAGAARPGEAAHDSQAARTQRVQAVERPIPSEIRSDAPPGSAIDILV